MSGTTGRADNRPVVLMAKYADEMLSYSVSLASILGDASVTGIAVSTAPSGTGELTTSGLDTDGETATIVISAGQPGRIYTIKYAITLDTGDVRELLATLTVTRFLVTDQAPAPPDTGFGPTLDWPAGVAS